MFPILFGLGVSFVLEVYLLILKRPDMRCMSTEILAYCPDDAVSYDSRSLD